MKILALEFSASERSVALAESDGTNVQLLQLAVESSRAITGLALIDRVLRQASFPPAGLTHLVIGLGPGSYTGIRSAIALAQGWQLGRNVQTVGLSSMLCLAATAHARGSRGDLSFVVDAQRGDLYQQAFLLTDKNFEPTSTLGIIPAPDLATAKNVLGPDASKFVPGATDLTPSAEHLAHFANRAAPCPAEELQPIYLRAASFVKAPPPRHIG